MIKKLIAILLIILVMFTFSSCKKSENEKEYGEITDLSFDYSPTDKEISLFKEEKEPFDYNYTSITLKLPGLSFKVPESWSAELKNARYIKLDTPTDDPVFPSSTFIILTSLETGNEFTSQPSLYDSKIFNDELPVLLYKLGKYEYYEGFNDNRSSISYYTEDTFTDNPECISVSVISSPSPLNSFYKRPLEEVVAIHYNINCSGTPLTLRTMVFKEYEENAKTMLSFIASSIKELPSKDISFKTESFKDITIEIPYEMQKKETSYGVLFTVSEKTNSSLSGTKIIITDIESDEIESDLLLNMNTAALDSELIDSGYYRIKHDFLDDPFPITIGGRPAFFSQEVATVFLKAEKKDVSFYSSAINMNICYFFIELDNNRYKLIALFYPPKIYERMGVIIDRIMEKVVVN